MGRTAQSVKRQMVDLLGVMRWTITCLGGVTPRNFCWLSGHVTDMTTLWEDTAPGQEMATHMTPNKTTTCSFFTMFLYGLNKQDILWWLVSFRGAGN